MATSPPLGVEVGDRNVVEQRRPELARQSHVRGIGPRGHRDAALRLEEAVNLVADGDLRPAAHNLACVEALARHARRVHAVAVRAERNRTLAGAEVEPAGLEHQLLTRVLLHLRPRAVRVLGQLDVFRRVVGKPDDARVVLGLATDMAELELLETEHAGTGAAGEPVRRGAAESTETKNHIFEIGLQPSFSRTYRRMSRLALSISA